MTKGENVIIISYTIEFSLDEGTTWHDDITAPVTTDRTEAEESLARREEAFPNTSHRIKEETFV